ncbi:MAG TPA: helix-hairpin-helix domain-containing protein [Chloroflexota bacterium]|nr:helix-hairpin-helix domain-containing protein [Chloroflexota bacterium]
MENREAARALFGVASLLESQGANPYRVRAYRRAAVNLLRLPEHATSLTDDAGQLDVPWLGDRLRRKVGELVTQGKMQFFEDYLGELPKPLRALLAVPGVGPKTADRLINELRIRTPRGLLHRARRGHLQRLRGFGPTRESQLATAAEQVLGEQRRAAPTPLPHRPIQLSLPEAA